jgi:predicted kinase
MVGLPRSGKTTEAKQMGHPIVNRDAIRQTLSPDNSIRYFEEEDRVTEIERIMVTSLFNAGHNDVIVDACHVKRKYRLAWERFAASPGYKIYYFHVMTSLETCLARARRTHPEDPGFPHVIRQMWEGSYLDGSIGQIPEFQKEYWM